MLLKTLGSIFDRDLKKLRSEIELYKNEDALWKVDKNIANPGGNLCLHLVGNLNAFIGTELGKSGYVRNRDLEFSAKGIPKAELLQKVDQTIDVVKQTLGKLSEGDLEKEYPLKIPALVENSSTGYFLVYLATHLDYHLGQINYHRRLLDT
jgi:hypothetical protein